MNAARDPVWISIFKGLIFFLVLLGLVFLLYYFDVAGIIDSDDFHNYITGKGAWGVALFTLVCAAGSLASAPRQLLSFCGGYLFGPLCGLVWGTLGMVTGCVGGFFFARLFGRHFFARLLRGRADKLNNLLCREPFSTTLAIRLMPVGHNATTNILAGLSSMPALPFFAASALGYLPQNLIFAFLGSGIRVSPLLSGAVSALLFIGASLLGYWIYRRHSKRIPGIDEMGNLED